MCGVGDCCESNTLTLRYGLTGVLPARLHLAHQLCLPGPPEVHMRTWEPGDLEYLWGRSR